MKPPYAIGSVPSLSGHAVAYRCGVNCRESAGTGPVNLNFEQMLRWQVTMDRLICSGLSHSHYWYEVGMLKVPAAKATGTRFRDLIKKMFVTDLVSFDGKIYGIFPSET